MSCRALVYALRRQVICASQNGPARMTPAVHGQRAGRAESATRACTFMGAQRVITARLAVRLPADRRCQHVLSAHRLCARGWRARLIYRTKFKDSAPSRLTMLKRRSAPPPNSGYKAELCNATIKFDAERRRKGRAVRPISELGAFRQALAGASRKVGADHRHSSKATR